MQFSILKHRNVFFIISLLVIVPGLYSLLRYGLKPAIDFTGGSLLEVKYAQADSKKLLERQDIQAVAADIYEINSVQKSGDNQIIVRGKTISNDQKDAFIKKLSEKYGQIEEVRFASVGPILGRELLVKTLAAVLLASIAITLYVWRQFNQLMFGVCAILAMLHDSLVLLGIFSLLGYFMGVEVDVLFVTALLTTLSFSVHDTIVVYDRIRELRKNHPNQSLEELADAAVLETMGRSVNNSVTIIIMLLSLVLLGGESIRWFAVALLIGAISGTYSSPFTAVPLLLVWNEKISKKKI
ncbi:MAG: protein translocase subunit SecF [Patescibacteria group bacterium]